MILEALQDTHILINIKNSLIKIIFYHLDIVVGVGGRGQKFGIKLNGQTIN